MVKNRTLVGGGFAALVGLLVLTLNEISSTKSNLAQTVGVLLLLVAVAAVAASQRSHGR